MIPGVGVVPASVVRDLIGMVGARFTRTLLDARTGVTRQTSTTSYRPTEPIRQFVRARDQHCRFPGCTARPAICDLDHVVAWPTGPTAGHNLHLLCRHHHRAKHQDGWTVTMAPDGAEQWISPTGDRYQTTSAD